MSRAQRRRLAWATCAILLALALAVAVLRLHRLEDLPRELYGSEAAHGINALQVLEGKHAVYFRERFGREGLIVFAVAAAISFLGQTVLAVRLPAALAGAATVFALFWLGWLLFRQDEKGKSTPWRGLFIGGVAAGLLATSLSQTIVGRAAFQGNLLPLLLTLCIALLWWGWSSRSWWGIALAGLCAGLLQYTYVAARFTPLLYVLFGLCLLPALLKSKTVELRKAGLSLPGCLRNLPSAMRAEGFWVGLFLVLAWTVAAPILVYYHGNPADFWGCNTKVYGECGGYWFVDHFGLCEAPANLVRNLWGHLRAFGFGGDLEMGGRFASLPMLSPWELIFFLIGAGVAVYRSWRSPAFRMLILWLGVMLLPAFGWPEGGDGLPDGKRMIGLVPAVYLLAGIGIWELLRALWTRIGAPLAVDDRRVHPRGTRKVFVAAAIGAGIVLLQGVSSHRTYFATAALPLAPDSSRTSYVASIGDLAKALNRRPSDPGAVYLLSIGSPYWGNLASNCTFQYLYQGEASVAIVDLVPDQSIYHHFVPRNMERVLRDAGDSAAVRLLQGKSDGEFIDNRITPFDFLLRKYGRYTGSEEFEEFHIHNYADISLPEAWTFQERIEPLSVEYDGGITLLGIALAQDEGQLPVRAMKSAGQGISLWAVLRWHTIHGVNLDYSVSLRLYDTEGWNVFQMDELLRNQANRLSTSQWGPDTKADSVHLLDLPTDMPPGEYELRLVMYEAATLVPTVEIGVREAEKTLTRLLLTDSE